MTSVIAPCPRPYWHYNRDLEEIREFEQMDDAGRLRWFARIGDSSWMSFFAHRLTQPIFQIKFPLRVLPHFGLPESRVVVNSPAELTTALETAIDVSPVGEVSIEILS
jgi:hypothetical protein